MSGLLHANAPEYKVFKLGSRVQGEDTMVKLAGI